MTRPNGTIVTVIIAAFTLLCCTVPLCVGGIMLLAGLGDWSSTLGTNVRTGTIPPAAGIAPCCLGILVLVVPLLCWLFLVRGKGDTAVVEEEFEGIIEDDFEL